MKRLEDVAPAHAVAPLARILELQARKRALADAALSEAGGAAAITREDLLALLS